MVDKTYLLNHPDFKSRRDMITNNLNIEGIDYEIIDSYLPNDIDYDGLTNNYFKYENIIIEQVGMYSYYNHPKKISHASLSLVLKHIHCWEDQLKNNYDYVLILEDDCEIVPDFKSLISKSHREMIEGEYDIVMVGGFSDFISPNIQVDKTIHYSHLQKTRCTHAYLISKKSALIMKNGFNNINNPIDIKMNEVIQLNKLRVAWLEPGLKQL